MTQANAEMAKPFCKIILFICSFLSCVEKLSGVSVAWGWAALGCDPPGRSWNRWTREGKGHYELGETWIRGISVVDAILNRIRIENRLNRRCSLLTHERVRDILDGSSGWLCQSQSFIRHKEESAIPTVVQSR
jgi:hypothetical protein